MIIKSNVIPNCEWKISREIMKINGARALRHSPEIHNKEVEFIKNLNPVVFNNDLSGEMWCFDTKLPSGGWLENIKCVTDSNGKITFSGLILC